MFLKKIKFILIILVVAITILPRSSFAIDLSGKCANSGYTVSTINGIFTDEEGAKDNEKWLKYFLKDTYKGEKIDYKYLLNPSHLGGAGDIVISAYQKYFESETVQDYDLIEMLKDASEKVTTQKLLLVAHSQGNFYANSFYDVVTKQIVGGIPQESIGVYGVANPASHVRGNGLYLTSRTDLVINSLAPNAPTNDRIEEVSSKQYLLNPSATHYFSEVYLKYRGNKIISNIQSSLDRLQANSVQDTQKPCLAPPRNTMAHTVAGDMLGVADSAVHISVAVVGGVVSTTYNGSVMLGQAAGQGMASLQHSASLAIAATSQALGNMLSAKSWTLASALYGSSVTKADLGEEDSAAPTPVPISSVSTPTFTSTPVSLPSPLSLPPITPERLDSRFRGNDSGEQDTPKSIALSGGLLMQKNNTAATPQPSPKSSFVSVNNFASSGSAVQSIFQELSGGSSGSSGTVSVTSQSSSSATVSNSSSLTMGTSTTSTSTASSTATTSTTTATTTTPTATSTTATSSTLTADTQAPTISFAVNECISSLSSDGCLIATTTISLKWLTPDSDLAHYILDCTTNGTQCANFSFASTTATSTIYITSTDATTYTFTAKAIDASGNESISQTIAVDVWLHPVVINEIAWAGTGSSAKTDKDEWLELYNPTSKNISLANMMINSPTNSSLKINLANTIAAKGFYLIERTNNTVISDITADLTPSFGSGLSNNGEQLTLMLGSTTIDKTPTVGAGNSCLTWCAGAASGLYYTMERYDALSSGEDRFNWGSWQSLVAYGTNAETQPIKGTPGHRNAVNYLITLGSSINTSKTITKANSPYVVPTQTVIGSPATLTIEPGVMLKFKGSNSGLYGNGIIVIQGSAADPVVLTSFADDSYGGDTNQNGTSTMPKAGDWGSVILLKNGSSMNYALVRFAGGDSELANVKVKNAAADITHSTIEYSKWYGVYLDNASGTIEANIIRKNTAQNNIQSTGMRATDGNLVIRNNTFAENYAGLVLFSGNASHNLVVENNIFLNNTTEAIHNTLQAIASFSGNTASGNGINGITLGGSMPQDYTLSPDLPYVINGYSVPVGKTLTILPGVVIKFQPNGELAIEGRLRAEGSANNPIIFTSIHDDDCGIIGGCGDTDNASTTPVAGDWLSIWFQPNSGPSTLAYTSIRFGGRRTYPQTLGAIHILSNASLEVSHATIEKNYYAGVWIEHASPHISDSLIQDHVMPSITQSYGLFLMSSSTPTITNNHFKHNGAHISTSDPTSVYIDGGGNVGE